jgi:hypothetical protein
MFQMDNALHRFLVVSNKKPRIDVSIQGMKRNATDRPLQPVAWYFRFGLSAACHRQSCTARGGRGVQLLVKHIDLSF